MTRAVEQPMIKMPPIISPQRTLLCSMNAARTSANGLRGSLILGVARASSESFAHAPNCGADLSGVCSSRIVGVMNGGGALILSAALGALSGLLISGLNSEG